MGEIKDRISSQAKLRETLLGKQGDERSNTEDLEVLYYNQTIGQANLKEEIDLILQFAVEFCNRVRQDSF
jgi:hypothetical protein